MNPVPDPTVTISIVAHDEEATISRCLESIISPVWPTTQFEICVVDQNSQDRTRERALGFAAKYPDVNFRIQELTANHMGLARATAISSSRAKYVAFLDADCTAPPRWVDQLVTNFQSHNRDRSNHRKLVAVGSGNKVPSPTDLWFYRALAAMFHTFVGNLGSVQAKTMANSKAVSHLSTCNVVYDRDQVLAAGNFSPHFDRVAEDLELSYRLTRLGYSLHYVAGLEVVHFHRPDLHSWLGKMFRYGVGQTLVARLHPRLFLGPRGLPLAGVLAASAITLMSWRLGAVAGMLYLALMAFISSQLSPRFQVRTLQVFGLLVLSQAFYAAGEVAGLVAIFRTLVMQRSRHSLRSSDRSRKISLQSPS